MADCAEVARASVVGRIDRGRDRVVRLRELIEKVQLKAYFSAANPTSRPAVTESPRPEDAPSGGLGPGG